MPEQKKENSIERSTIIVIIILIFIFIGVLIAISIVYSRGRNNGPPINTNIINISSEYEINECTQTMLNVTPIAYLSDEEPFPYRYYSYIYRPSVIIQQVALIFGFRHDNVSWALDEVSFYDITGDTEIMQDGGFESNYLTKYYQPLCILSNTRSATSDILFDLPYQGDFYYNDQTNVGMTYLIQYLNVVGGRYYNISFYLENRGYPINYFILLVGSIS